MDLYTVLALLVGLVVGALACWLLLRRRPVADGAVERFRAEVERLKGDGDRLQSECGALRSENAGLRHESEGLRREAAGMRSELDATRGDLGDARLASANARTEIEAARTEAARAGGEVERARASAESWRAEVAEARQATAEAMAEASAFEARVSAALAERDAAVARGIELAADRASLQSQFKLLSTEALEKQSKAADASAEHRLRATELLMTPMKESLQALESRLQEVEKERVAMATDLRNQVANVALTGESLRRETAALTTALRKPQVRGTWGELQLRRVVELSGMVEHCDFVEQETSTTDNATIRPDLKVTLTQGKFVYVDSKVPLTSFLDAQDAAEAVDRQRSLALFAKNVRDHVDGLSKKQYWKADQGTPEFVVMFIPSEALLIEALQQMPDLIEAAAGKNIIVATPSTLIAMLRSVAYGWTQASLAESAREVTTLGQELYGRLATLGGHFDKVGRSLGASVKAYNMAVASMEGRVMVTARKFRDLKVTSEELPEVTQVQETVRQIGAPELVDDAVKVEPMLGRSLRAESPRPALTQAGSSDLEGTLFSRQDPEVDELVEQEGQPVMRVIDAG